MLKKTMTDSKRLTGWTIDLTWFSKWSTVRSQWQWVRVVNKVADQITTQPLLMPQHNKSRVNNIQEYQSNQCWTNSKNYFSLWAQSIERTRTLECGFDRPAISWWTPRCLAGRSNFFLTGHLLISNWSYLLLATSAGCSLRRVGSWINPVFGSFNIEELADISFAKAPKCGSQFEHPWTCARERSRGCFSKTIGAWLKEFIHAKASHALLLSSVTTVPDYWTKI